MRLMRADNLHSRLVGWLKILLPLAALSVLATLFLVSRKIDPSDAIPYAKVDVEDRLRTPRMTDAAYSGVTADGTAISVHADAAVPEADGNARVTGLLASLDAADGSSTRFTAATGRLDATAKIVTLSGGVVIDSSTGYRIRTEALDMALDQTLVQVPGQVLAEGPPGQITADRMTLNSADGTGRRHQLVFNGNVKLVYQPAE